MALITYTAIAGGKDKLHLQPASKFPYVAFVDDIAQDIEGWQLKRVSSLFVDPVRNAKMHKILPHLYLDTKVSLWIDGNITLKKPPEHFLQYLGKYDVVMLENSHGCVYKEAEAIKREKYEADEVVDEQVRYLHNRGVPQDYGAYAPGIMLRRHNNKTQEFMERWWAEICRGSRRDILTVKYAAKNLSVRIGTFPMDLSKDNEYFTINDHAL